MSIVIICTQRDPLPWKQALLDVDPELDIQVWPNEMDKTQVEFALCWLHPEGVLQDYPNLKCISSMGAGIDHFLNDKTFPQRVDVVRVVAPLIGQSMFEYLAAVVLDQFRQFSTYRNQQQQSLWHRQPPRLINQTCVGILGLGEIGQYCATKLSNLGFSLAGWSNSPKGLDNIADFVGDEQLPEFLNQVDILICLLPLTERTKGILNLDLFKQLRPNAYVINVARGEHLVEQDLIDAIEQGVLAGACLDTFIDEPLPPEHPFWQHPTITVTPHCSSVTQPHSVAEQIVQNYYAMRESNRLINQVDIRRGY